MAEYIDREQLGIGYADRKVFENKGYADGWNAAIDIITKATVANVAEVVYCADCRWCEDMGMSGLYCNHPDNRNPAGCRPKDYCSDGERRIGDEVQHTQTDGEGDESGTGGMPTAV